MRGSNNSPFKIGLDEKMRSSHLGGFKLQSTWWEYEKFSLSLPSRLDLMRRGKVLAWGAFIFNKHDEMMRSSHLGGLCYDIVGSPPKENFSSSHQVNLEGRDNENFSYSHQVNWSLKPPKRELLIFSSCQLSFKLQLTWWEDEKFSLSLPSRLDFMRRWEVLVWGEAIFDRHDEKMRSSCLRGCHIW